MTPWSTKGFIAACIAGPVYLRKFRRLAEQSGLDPDVWFNNVEQDHIAHR
ncbi:MAG TPA: hypothetical protein VE914_15895 [Candidatus Angelobacter sp.]|nr:hypothetical protein [Candidatus Angelobacter sp.]